MARTDNRGAFIWYELLTNDVDGARAFYRDVVGWEIAAEGQPLPTGATYRMIARSDGGNAGGVLSLTEDAVAQGARPGWLGYVHHPDVDAAVEQVRAAGGAVHMPAIDMPGVGRMAMVADPQGAAFYVMDPAPPAHDPGATSDVFDPVRAQHMRWNELQTSDPAAAVTLYSGLFGWKQEGSMPMDESGDYLFITHDETAIGAVMPEMPGERTAWTFYVGVDDIDRAAEAVSAGGGTLMGEISEIPGGEFAVHCLDPQGAAIGLVGPRIGT